MKNITCSHNFNRFLWKQYTKPKYKTVPNEQFYKIETSYQFLLPGSWLECESIVVGTWHQQENDQNIVGSWKISSALSHTDSDAVFVFGGMIRLLAFLLWYSTSNKMTNLILIATWKYFRSFLIIRNTIGHRRYDIETILQFAKTCHLFLINIHFHQYSYFNRVNSFLAFFISHSYLLTFPHAINGYLL